VKKQMLMRTKIILGFSIVILLLAVVGIGGVWALMGSNGGFDTYQALAKDSNLAAEIEAQTLLMRMEVKNYIIEGSEEAKRNFMDRYDELFDRGQTAITEITSEKRAPMVAEINTGILEYKKNFDDVVTKQEARNDLVINTMDVIGPQIEQNLTRLMESARSAGDETATYYAAETMRNLLLFRLYAVKFLEDNERASEDRAIDEFEKMEANLAILDRELQNPGRRAILADIREKDQIYKDAFEEVAQIIYTRNTVIESKLDVIGPQIASYAQDIFHSVEEDQGTTGDNVQGQNNFFIFLIIGMGLVAVMIGVAFAIWTTTSILAQLGADPAQIQEVAERVALGDLEMKNEDKAVGVYNSIQKMVQALQSKVESVESMADGDLTQIVSPASAKDRLGISMVQMQNSLNEILSQVDQAVVQMASGADQVSTASQDLSQGATEQASSLEEISASTNEIGGQSDQNSNSASQAASLAKKNTEDAKNGDALMDELLVVMSQISESADNTKKIVKTIDDIAFQVNLLALNANVEAARAGKYGRGFAVVAEEVRTLAVRSAQAVKETTQMVEESQSRVENGNEKAKLTGGQLKEIVTASVKVSDILDEIAHASKEQALAINQINKGLEQIDQVTQSNTASAEESASASEELASQAQHLKNMLKRFKLSSSKVHALPGPAQGSPNYSQTSTPKIRKVTPVKDDDKGGVTKEATLERPDTPKGKIVLDGDFEDF
jgi:methyl-accepting chemotaxis protein